MTLPAPLDPVLWRDLVGAPFRHRGRGPSHFDCLGLVLEISKRQGIIVPDAASPADYPDDAGAQSALFASHLPRWQRLAAAPAGSFHPGAVLLFRHGALASHVGVQIDADRFVHATEAFGQVRLDRLSRGAPPPQKLLIGAYRYVQDH